MPNYGATFGDLESTILYPGLWYSHDLRTQVNVNILWEDTNNIWRHDLVVSNKWVYSTSLLPLKFAVIIVGILVTLNICYPNDCYSKLITIITVTVSWCALINWTIIVLRVKWLTTLQQIWSKNTAFAWGWNIVIDINL